MQMNWKCSPGSGGLLLLMVITNSTRFSNINKKGSAADQSNAKPSTTNQNCCHNHYTPTIQSVSDWQRCRTMKGVMNNVW